MRGRGNRGRTRLRKPRGRAAEQGHTGEHCSDAGENSRHGGETIWLPFSNCKRRLGKACLYGGQVSVVGPFRKLTSSVRAGIVFSWAVFGCDTPTSVRPCGDSSIAKKLVFRKRVFRKRMKWLRCDRWCRGLEGANPSNLIKPGDPFSQVLDVLPDLGAFVRDLLLGGLVRDLSGHR